MCVGIYSSSYARWKVGFFLFSWYSMPLWSLWHSVIYGSSCVGTIWGEAHSHRCSPSSESLCRIPWRNIRGQIAELEQRELARHTFFELCFRFKNFRKYHHPWEKNVNSSISSSEVQLVTGRNTVSDHVGTAGCWLFHSRADISQDAGQVLFSGTCSCFMKALRRFFLRFIWNYTCRTNATVPRRRLPLVCKWPILPFPLDGISHFWSQKLITNHLC